MRPDGNPTRVFLAGDSSVCSREAGRAPMTGWGQTLPLFFTRDVEIVNCARAGASSRTFAERGRLAWILEHLRPGDYLVTSFGLIDHKPEKEWRTEAFHDYQRYLRYFVDGARDRGAHPVLVSPHERCTWDEHGNLRQVFGEYPMAMKELAAETSTPYLDLYAQSLEWWTQLGPEGTRALFMYLAPGVHPNYPEGIEDSTHLLPEGAVACARFVAHQLAVRRIVPAHWVTALDTPTFAPHAFGWLDDAEHAALTRARTRGAGETL
ncbi:rhamnogalacturonan acetylesterase [Streptomyces sp. S.PB5]|uniref:rhamnogalacturonan acetylesterase n=1 Tax=Streptomyces sp. S.PB5 TaxID=3020844 RepID=UPI0025B1A2EC|nr:rhamnogalacturonan acetylesterase [Streptomyces sp. S.PB5]MDN3021498.1 rhamnogalacturonan acetylesterase [Streptomyces sp. S.PB5]